MGNVNEKDGKLKVGDDGQELMFGTVARDISYSNFRAKKVQNNQPISGISRIDEVSKESIDSFSCRKALKKERGDGSYKLSEMEIRVDGKVAK